MRNAGLQEAQAGIKIARRKINNLRYADDTTLMAKIRDFPGGSDSKESACNAGDQGLISGSGKSSGEENGNLLQYSCLENLMDGGVLLVTVHGAAKSQTRLSDFHFMPESEELKSLLIKVNDESEKVGLKLNIQKTKIMASGPIISWHIDGETVETVTDFIFLDSKFTADVDCSHEIKRHLLCGRKVLTNLDNILKNRDFTLSTKFCLVKAMVSPVVIYGCESWTLKKAEC